jgi:hypothetical protein
VKPLALVISRKKALTNFILGIAFYYQNQPLLDPEAGLMVMAFDQTLQIGLRIDNR